MCVVCQLITGKLKKFIKTKPKEHFIHKLSIINERMS